MRVKIFLVVLVIIANIYAKQLLLPELEPEPNHFQNEKWVWSGRASALREVKK